MTYRNFTGESGERKKRCVAHATSDETCELTWPTLAIGEIRIHVQAACDESEQKKNEWSRSSKENGDLGKSSYGRWHGAIKNTLG